MRITVAGWLIIIMFCGCQTKDSAVQKKVMELHQEGLKAIQAKKYDIAEMKFKEAIELDPKDQHVKNNLAVLYAQFMHQYDKAKPIWEELLKETPENSTYINNLAGSYLAMGETNEALKMYETAKAKSKQNYHMPYYNIGKIYLEQKKYDQAIDELYAGLAIAPQDTMLIVTLSKTLMLQSRISEAESILVSKCEKFPGNITENLYLTRLYIRQKQYDKAAAVVAARLSKEPQNLFFLAEKTFIALESSTDESNVRELLSAIKPEMDPELSSWFNSLIEADLKFRGGDVDSAIELLNSIEGKIGENWIYYEAVRQVKLADCFRHKNELEKAGKHHLNASSIFPEFFPAAASAEPTPQM